MRGNYFLWFVFSGNRFIIDSEMMFWFFLLGLLISLVGTHFAVKGFPKLGLLDFPERYGLKRARIPYPGGLMFLLSSLFLPFIDPLFLPLSFALGVVGCVSFIDDRRPLSPWLRAVVYGMVVVSLFFLGIRIDFIGNPLAETNIELGFWPSLILTFVWVLSIQQSLNWFDGIKGLAVGIGGIGFFFLGILGLIHPELFFDPQETTSLWANFFLSGLCFGGWWYFFSGKIILGDTGAQTIGFLLAIMSIFTGAKVGTTLLVLALPLLDTVAVVFRRVFVEKRSPVRGDLKHLPHNAASFFGEQKSVLVLLGVSVIFGVLGTMLSGFEKLVAVVCASVVVLFGIVWMFRKNS